MVIIHSFLVCLPEGCPIFGSNCFQPKMEMGHQPSPKTYLEWHVFWWKFGAGHLKAFLERISPKAPWWMILGGWDSPATKLHLGKILEHPFLVQSGILLAWEDFLLRIPWLSPQVRNTWNAWNAFPITWMCIPGMVRGSLMINHLLSFCIDFYYFISC
jgi:hypothetical protein